MSALGTRWWEWWYLNPIFASPARINFNSYSYRLRQRVKWVYLEFLRFCLNFKSLYIRTFQTWMCMNHLGILFKCWFWVSESGWGCESACLRCSQPMFRVPRPHLNCRALSWCVFVKSVGGGRYTLSPLPPDKYSSQFGGGSQYAYFHEEDETSFQLVDTARTQKTAYQRNRMRFAQVGQEAAVGPP